MPGNLARPGEPRRGSAGTRALRAQLPVPVEVWHNWTARHCDGYEQGADHIVVRASLRAGRLNREEGQPLCWTPSRAHELRYVEPAAQDERNLPDCKACLRHAEKLAARPATDREGQRAASLHSFGDAAAAEGIARAAGIAAT